MKRSAKDKPAIVYMATNRINGKRYIGVTTHTSLRRRESEHVCGAMRKEHNGAFHRAIRKYGRDAFDWSILLRCTTASEALREEVRLVAEMRPEYNSTKGGEHPPYPTPEVIERLKALHAGNEYRLGKRHSEKTKELLREHAIKQRQWEKWGNTGPMSSAKRVVCLDDGLTFESASEAARHYKIAKSLIISVCRRYKKYLTADGRVFRYFGDHHGGLDESIRIKASIYSGRKSSGTHNQVAVRCLDDGREFRSFQKAAEAYGLNALDVSAVCRGYRGRKTARGKRFEKVNHAPAP